MIASFFRLTRRNSKLTEPGKSERLSNAKTCGAPGPVMPRKWFSRHAQCRNGRLMSEAFPKANRNTCWRAIMILKPDEILQDCIELEKVESLTQFAGRSAMLGPDPLSAQSEDVREGEHLGCLTTFAKPARNLPACAVLNGFPTNCSSGRKTGPTSSCECPVIKNRISKRLTMCNPVRMPASLTRLLFLHSREQLSLCSKISVARRSHPEQLNLWSECKSSSQHHDESLGTHGSLSARSKWWPWAKTAVQSIVGLI